MAARMPGPVWAVWFEDVLYFSTGSLAAVNLVANPEITVHLDLGNDVLIIEGAAEIVGNPPLLRRMVDVYNQKYHWDVDPGEPAGSVLCRSTAGRLRLGRGRDGHGRRRYVPWHGDALEVLARISDELSSILAGTELLEYLLPIWSPALPSKILDDEPS